MRLNKNFQPYNNFRQNNNPRPNNVVTCFNCNEKGHIRPNCPKLQQTFHQGGGDRIQKAIMAPLN